MFHPLYIDPDEKGNLKTVADDRFMVRAPIAKVIIAAIAAAAASTDLINCNRRGGLASLLNGK